MNFEVTLAGLAAPAESRNASHGPLPKPAPATGLGLIVAVLALGAALNAGVFGRVMLTLGTLVLERIPLVKTVPTRHRRRRYRN